MGVWLKIEIDASIDVKEIYIYIRTSGVPLSWVETKPHTFINYSTSLETIDVYFFLFSLFFFSLVHEIVEYNASLRHPPPNS